MDEEEGKTTEKLGVGRKKSMELKITGYGKIPSILTIVLIAQSDGFKLLTLCSVFVLMKSKTSTVQVSD